MHQDWQRMKTGKGFIWMKLMQTPCIAKKHCIKAWGIRSSLVKMKQRAQDPRKHSWSTSGARACWPRLRRSLHIISFEVVRVFVFLLFSCEQMRTTQPEKGGDESQPLTASGLFCRWAFAAAKGGPGAYILSYTSTHASLYASLKLTSFHNKPNSHLNQFELYYNLWCRPHLTYTPKPLTPDSTLFFRKKATQVGHIRLCRPHIAVTHTTPFKLALAML